MIVRKWVTWESGGINCEHCSQLHLVIYCQLLTSTGLFEFNKDELSLWIRSYTGVLHRSDVENLTSFMSKVFTTFISNPYPYSDKVNDYVSEGMSLESSGPELDTLSIGTTDSNIDGRCRNPFRYLSC